MTLTELTKLEAIKEVIKDLGIKAEVKEDNWGDIYVNTRVRSTREALKSYLRSIRHNCNKGVNVTYLADGSMIRNGDQDIFLNNKEIV